MSRTLTHARFLLPMLATIACGPGSVPEYDAFECVETQTMCVTLKVPDNYAGTPRELATGFYDSSDTARPPTESLPAIEYPSIVAGEDYQLSHDQIDFEGDFYLLFILYDEDGGLWIPEPDIDYTAGTTQSIQMDGEPVDLGALTLTPAD